MTKYQRAIKTPVIPSNDPTMDTTKLLQALAEAAKRGEDKMKELKREVKDDSWSLKLLTTLMEKISWVKGDKGDKGDPGIGIQGPIGFRGEKGEKGDFVQGPKGEKGDMGDCGMDGKDGNANMSEVVEMVDHSMESHEAEYDHALLHNSFLLGTKTVDEEGIGAKKILMYNGMKWVCADLPKTKSAGGGGGGGMDTRFRIKTVTADYTVDPHDQILHVDCTSGNITITFYSAVSNEGRHCFIKRVDASSNTLTLSLQGTETVEFEVTDQLPNRGSGREVYSNGSNWFIKHT